MSIPLPRPVGIASEVECIIIETVKPVDADEMLQQLNRNTPAELCMQRVRQLETGQKPQADLVRYRMIPGETLPGNIEANILRLMESDVVRVERTNPEKKITRTVDIRPYLVDIRVDHDAVEWTLRVTERGTARPSEIAGLLGYDSKTMNYRIRRMEVRWR